MQFKNAIYITPDMSRINIDLEHPAHGWIPITIDPEEYPELWQEVIATGPAPYVAPVVDPEEELRRWREDAICSQAQMRIALLRMGLLETVEAIARSNPEANIAWEYASKIMRTSPLIDALGGEGGFTPEQIDHIFTVAMQVQV